MSIHTPKAQLLAFLNQKRMRMFRATQYLFGDFWGSINYTDEIESEIQFFLDSHTNVDNFLELPACPFLDEMWNYCFLRSSPNPQISTPFSADFPQVDSAAGVNYNGIFLALILTHKVLPSYERRPPAAYEDVHSLEIKKSQILGLGIALVRAQECFGGEINGVFYWGLEFLSRTASAYGVTASFFPLGPEDLDFTAP